MDNPDVRRSYIESQNPSNAVFGIQRIEHKPNDIIQPAEQAGTDDTMEIEMSISAERESLKDYPAIYKLAGIIMDKKIELEAFRDYIFKYGKMGQPEQIESLVGWVSKVEQIDDAILKSDETGKKYYLKDWGNK